MEEVPPLRGDGPFLDYLDYFFGVGAGVGVGDGLAAGFASPDVAAAPAGVLSGAAPGAGTLSGGGFLSLIDISSTSKTRVALGPIGPPGVPRGP